MTHAQPQPQHPKAVRPEAWLGAGYAVAILTISVGSLAVLWSVPVVRPWVIDHVGGSAALGLRFMTIGAAIILFMGGFALLGWAAERGERRRLERALVVPGVVVAGDAHGWTYGSGPRVRFSPVGGATVEADAARRERGRVEGDEVVVRYDPLEPDWFVLIPSDEARRRARRDRANTMKVLATGAAALGFGVFQSVAATVGTAHGASPHAIHVAIRMVFCLGLGGLFVITGALALRRMRREQAGPDEERLDAMAWNSPGEARFAIMLGLICMLTAFH